MGKFATDQRGFTLIEMSIVLVIIGLIVGGILKGQELIESARQKNVITQIDQIKSGVTNFIDRFKGYPGDYSRASTVLSSFLQDGNDDGRIGTANGDIGASLQTKDATLTEESVQFWTHLLAANAIGGGTLVDKGGTAPASFSGQSTTPSPLPAAAFPQTGLSVVFGTHQGTTATSGTSKEGHWLILHRWKTGANLSTSDAGVSPARVFQMDNKYDDGAPNSGNIRTIYGASSNCGAAAATAYTATATDNTCIPIFLLE